ncbi:MAG: choice-of-anchor J domain-containing protein [Bacteroidetes bacterium]|nr:choice-of-anchor J domain-containing protein [Bacteroidota bacterium]
MKSKVLLFVLALIMTQTSIGQFSRINTGLKTQATVPYAWKASLEKSRLLNSLEENFDGYSDFTLDFSPWTTADVDGSATYGILDHTFPNSEAAMAYIVFNPSTVEPSMGADPAIQPHSGSKFAACFAAISPPNNDWIITPSISLGTNSNLSFWVKSYTAQYGLERYKVGVSTTNNDPASFTIISGSNDLEAPATAWQQKQFDLSAYDGMDVYIGIQCVSNDAFIFMLDDVVVTSEAATENTLYGQVTDALTGDPIPDALVTVAGISDYSDAEGNYSITGIPAGTLNANFTATPTTGPAPLAVQFTDLSSEGTQTVTASHEGYVTYTNSQVVIPDGGSLELAISLSPTLATGQMRFVLTWGESPSDLDSHLKTPSIEGNTYHVFYSQQGSADSPPYAILDIDDITSYGPETTTIYNLFTGEYHYYIYNYSGNPEITTSGAVVQIFNDNGLLHNLQIPTVGEGRYWDICTVNGATGAVNIINTITSIEPGDKSFDLMPPKKPQHKRDIVSWDWNFGDGTTTTLQNPSHTYTSDGTYTVSLTISDGTSSNTETKTQYIIVGDGGGGTSTLSGLVTDAITGEPVPDALVSVAGLSDYTDANGNYSITGIPAGTLNANFTGTPTTGTAPLAVQFTDLSSEGTHTVTASHEGYTTYTNSQVVIPDGGSLELAISLSPNLATGQMRFVLTWGVLPEDIDSHLKTPPIDGNSYHVYYSSQGSADSPPYAVLDIDDTDSYGPETTTIYTLYPGEYHYYIYNYDQEPEITTSGAVVQIFNDNGLLYNLQIPTAGEGLYWDVCTVNGSTGAVNVINHITDTEPGGRSFDPMPPKMTQANREIISWDWNFGDGTSSTLQNPSHTYNSNGTYTVSLTVNDGSASKTETKTNMIIVGPDGINEVKDNSVKMYPNPVKDYLSMEAESVILKAEFYSLNGQRIASQANGTKSLLMDVSALTPGTYVVIITTEKGIRQLKFNKAL